MSPSHEINRRSLGGGAEVLWLHDEQAFDHMIFVSDTEGVVVGVLSSTDGREAREMFDHPFVYRDVPDVFKSTPEPVSAVITPEEARTEGVI